MASTLQLDGLYKQLYASEIENLVPSCALVYNEVSFAAKEQQAGGVFVQPVILSQEQGWSYFAADSSAPTLTGNVDMATKPAQVMGAQMAGQAQLTVEAAKRALAKGPSAFEDAIGLQMRVLKESGVKRLEMNFLYGQSSVAIAATSSNVNSTTTSITIKQSDWAAGFWSGMKNAKFDLYQTGAYGAQTKINTNAAVVVSSVNANTRVITVTGNSTDITAVDAYIAANNNKAEFFFFGAYNVEAAGLKRQLTNTASLFNIDASVYDLWLGNTYSLGSPNALTFAQLQKAVIPAVNRGLDAEVDVLVSPSAWAGLLTDQAALRQYTSSGPSFENGATKLKFQSQNGIMNIRPHLFVKEGDTFIVPMKGLKRFGATDLTFDIPGTDKGRIFIQLPTTMGFEYRCYSHQTLFFGTPAQGVYVNGIVNA
jgi:hypothetical protein